MKFGKLSALLGVWIVGIGLSTGAIACPSPPQPRLVQEPLTLKTATGTHIFNVELAESEDEKSCGLMMRQSLRPDEGMLFDFRPARQIAMWMDRTPIPLDMIFISADGEVAEIVVGAVPFSRQTIATRGKAAAVLEVVSGTVDRLGIRLGDAVSHRWFAEPSRPGLPAPKN